MIPLGLCQCGCGVVTKIIDQNDRSQGLIKGTPRKYLHGHHRRQPMNLDIIGGPNPSGRCMCGCGRQTYRASRNGNGYMRGQYRRYLVGHPPSSRRGAKGDVNHDKRRYQRRVYENNRRARKLNQFIESVDPQTLYRMHGGMCGICKQFVRQSEFEVDHVIPLSKGGMHGYLNCQPAHPSCNYRKGNRC